MKKFLTIILLALSAGFITESCTTSTDSKRTEETRATEPVKPFKGTFENSTANGIYTAEIDLYSETIDNPVEGGKCYGHISYESPAHCYDYVIKATDSMDSPEPNVWIAGPFDYESTYRVSITKTADGFILNEWDGTGGTGIFKDMKFNRTN